MPCQKPWDIQKRQIIFYVFSRPDDARIIGNYFRGFKEDYVKFSGASNSVVAFDNFDGSGLALYVENCLSDRKGSGKLNELSNLLIYKNRLSHQ